MNKILDLRFVIGVFFTLIGILLFAYGFSDMEATTQPVNRWCGIIFTVFGIVMILLSFIKDADDELLKKR